MSHFKLGLIQVSIGAPRPIADKHNELETLARKCLDDGAELVFFPEAFQYVHDRAIKTRPQELKDTFDAWKQRMSELAKEYHAYIVPWDYELDDEGHIFNCSYVLNRNGNDIGHYHKVHLTNSECTGGITNGDSFPVFDLDFGKVGIMICFDNYWPESARCLALNGAELILYPLFGDTLVPNWEIKARCRAIDNCVYVAPCQLDNKYNIAYTGLISPTGDVLCKLDEPQSYQVVDVNLGKPVVTHTMANPKKAEILPEYLKKCRQPNAYKVITKPVRDALEWKDIFFGEEHNF